MKDVLQSSSDDESNLIKKCTEIWIIHVMAAL